MIKKILNVWRLRGTAGLIATICSRLLHYFLPARAESFQSVESLLRGKSGIEIGGPSQVFNTNGIFPVYPIVGRLDNCNFGGTTVWEGKIAAGQTYQFDKNKPPGQQFIMEATAMECIPSATYDFVLSSHALEHSANPILALSEWIRLLKDHGLLVLLLPHKEGTFDHRRPVTTIEHLLDDYNKKIGEDDLTHMPEILALHDLDRDPEAGDFDAFKARSERNFENRCFHHHVFDTHFAVNLIDHMGLQILFVEAMRPMHVLVLAQKMTRRESVDNSGFIGESARYRQSSPFMADRLPISGNKSLK